MATDVETLLARIEVQTSKFERDMARARQQTDRQTSAIERRFTEANANLSRAMDGINFGGLVEGARGAVAALGPLGAALTGVLSVAGFQQAADAYIRTINALKVAGLEGADLTRVYTELFEVAQRQGAPLEQLSRLYGQLAQAQGDLKVSSQDILGVVEATGQALRVSGVPASQASGAILGLSQALSGGTVRAEEFNQMLEGGLRPALQAVATGLEEAGGSVGKLRQLVTEGEVSSRAFFAALQAGQPVLQRLSDTAEGTTAQALERLKNELINLIGEVDRATGISSGFASVLGGIADAAGAMAAGVGRAAAAVQRFSEAFERFIGLKPELGAVAQEPLIVDVNGKVLSGGGPAQSVIEAQREAQRGRALGALPPAVKPVSLKQFPIDDDEETGGGGRAAAGRAQRISDYEREVQALNRRTAALNLDISTFGQSAEAISRAKIEQQLLNALQKDGVTVSDEQRGKIAELAQAYTETEARLKTMKDTQAAQNELTKFAGQAISSFFSDVVSGGKNAEQALMNLTKRLADAAFQAVLLGEGPLAKVFGTRGGGGFLGGLLKGFGFADGGYTGSGGRNEPAGIVHGGEYVFSKAAVEKLGVRNLDAMHRRARGFASGGYVGPPSGMGSRRSGGAPVSVVINNNARASVSAQETNDGGGVSLEIMIDEIVAGKVQTPGSRTRGAMSSSFGVSTPLARR
jgi:tape measure domain-containing protein